MLRKLEATSATSSRRRRTITPESLAALRERLAARRDAFRSQVIVSAGTCGELRGARDVVDALREELAAEGLARDVLFRVTGCHGFCAREPVVVFQPGNILYGPVRAGDAREIVSQTVAHGHLIERLLYTDEWTGEKVCSEPAIPFYAAQDRVLLSQHKWLDPKSIDDAIAAGSYAALAKVLASERPEDVVRRIRLSGLRGWEGGGLPVGPLWESLRIAGGDRDKCVVCCVDEGDPEAHIDRAVVEANAHAVLEGMIVGAYAMGAATGRVLLRGEHRLARQHLGLAIDSARRYGLLGTDILGTGFSFDVDVDRRTCESFRPGSAAPSPNGGPSGQQDPSSKIDRAETWARVPSIIRHGAAWFAGYGFGESPGTKIFSLSGPVKNAGFVEVPMGMSLRTIVLDIGGGLRDGRKPKAVQTGGPSGGCLPVSQFKLSVDFDSLAKAGSIVGSGGIVAMGPETCMVDVAKRSLEFLENDSCVRCASCRGTIHRILEILAGIVEGRGRPEHLEVLERLGRSGADSASCALDRAAAKPVLSTLKYFRNEYDAHIENGRCPAGVCSVSRH